MIQIIHGFASSLETQARNDAGRYADLILSEGGSNLRSNGEFSGLVDFAINLYAELHQRTDFWMFPKSQNMGTGSVAYSFLGKTATLIGPVTWGDDGVFVPSGNGVNGVRGPTSLVIPPRLFKTQIFVGKRNVNENINYNIQVRDVDNAVNVYAANQFLFQNNILQGTWPMGRSLYYDNSVDPSSPSYYQDYGVLQLGSTAVFTDRGNLLAPRAISSQVIPTNYTAGLLWLASNWARNGNASFGLLSDTEIDGATYSRIVLKYRETLGKNLPWYV